MRRGRHLAVYDVLMGQEVEAGQGHGQQLQHLQQHSDKSELLGSSW
jgi:hypothetical protein